MAEALPAPTDLVRRAIDLADTNLPNHQPVPLYQSSDLTISCYRDESDIIIMATIGSRTIRSEPILQGHRTWHMTSTCILDTVEFLKMVRQEMEDKNV